MPSGLAATAIITWGRCCLPVETSSSSTLKANRIGRSASGGSRRRPLRDVAGMIRSFHYATQVAASRSAGARRSVGADRRRESSLAEHLVRLVYGDLFEIVRGRGIAREFSPPGPSATFASARCLSVGEGHLRTGYELNNRPDWVHIPLDGILSLLDRAAGPADDVGSRQPPATRRVACPPLCITDPALNSRQRTTMKTPTKQLPVDNGFSLLTDDDLHLFNEGTHFQLPTKLGAHVVKQPHGSGVYFAVWAPNARQVSVAGDFNDWDKTSHNLQARGSSGIWEGLDRRSGGGIAVQIPHRLSTR